MEEKKVKVAVKDLTKSFGELLVLDDISFNVYNGEFLCIGRIREDSVYDWKFVGLSHNTVRGAAGGAVLCAELLKAQGFITAK